MSDPASSERDPVELLIEQFLELHRAGEPVTPEGFSEQHPEHRSALLELLPTLLALEDVKRDRISSRSGESRVALPQLDRLGDFRIERELGRGGMGVVFEAVQESLGRRVALKVLPRASLLTGNQLARFQHEAQIAARLHHTNIVPVYGSGESDGYHWYAMQFIAGQSLDQWREAQRERPPQGAGAWTSRARFVARIGVAAASALHAAHGQGTLHRDIKPGNFLLDAQDELWVTDFGLAKALENDALTRSGDMVGTLQYMAPEQFAGEYDVRSEVYALGVTLYELLTLAPAFRGRNRSELMARVRGHEVEALAKACPHAPRELVVIISKAMSSVPKDRYADAQALQSDLEAFLEDRPIAARRPSVWATTARWCRRNRGTAAAVLVASLAVLAAAVTGWTSYGSTQAALRLARSEGRRAENNLRLSLAAFGDVFDALVGRDAALDFDEDPETGEQTVVVQSAVSQRDAGLVQEMLAFYDRFAADNADSQSLRYETARANRRVGAIQVQLGQADNLKVAEEAFGRALSGFERVEDRDVREDIAQVHVDLGNLQLRQRRGAEAAAQFEAALALLKDLPDASSAEQRLARAKVLFDLYRSKDRFRRRRQERRGSDEYFAALALLGELQVEDGDNPEVRALSARCMREDARGPGGAEQQDQVVEVFRQLAVEHPERAEYQLEYCEAVLARARSRRSSSAEELAFADGVAARLVQQQPYFREYRSAFLRLRSRYAATLHREATARGEEGAADRARAVELIVSALEGAQAAAMADLRDYRFVSSVIGGRGLLGRILLAGGDKSGALEQASLGLDLIEAYRALILEAATPGRPGDPDGRGRSGMRRPDLRSLLREVDRDLSIGFMQLLPQLDDAGVRERLRKLATGR